MGFFAHKSLPNLLFGVLCLQGDQSHPFAQPTINPLACCIRWAGLLGRAVFPPWNEGPNFGSYNQSPLSGTCASFWKELHLFSAEETSFSTDGKSMPQNKINIKENKEHEAGAEEP